ncbi:MAG: HEAT repeat domain-containing protein [Bacillota bacterium]
MKKIGCFLLVFVLLICFPLTINAEEKINEDEIEKLIQELKDDDFKLSNQALQEILDYGKKVIPLLEENIKQTNDGLAKFKIINALEKINSPEGIPVIADYLKDEQQRPRDKAASALVVLAEKDKERTISNIKELLVNQKFYIRDISLKTLKEIGLNREEIVDILLDIFKNSDLEKQNRVLNHFQLMEKEAESAVPFLLDFSEDVDSSILKALTLETISSIQGKEAESIPHLKELLLDDNQKVRKTAIRGLEWSGYTGQDMASYLVKKMDKTNSFSEKEEIIMILGEMVAVKKEAGLILNEIISDSDREQKIRKVASQTAEDITPQMEYNIDRGLVAVNVDQGVYLSWRLLGTEKYDTPFNLYRDGKKVNKEPITDSTNYLDKEGSKDSQYYVRPLKEGEEKEKSEKVSVWKENYLSIPVKQIPGDDNWDYSIGDASTGDLDGDGQYEIVVTRIPPLEDQFIPGDDEAMIEAYKMDGTFLWRINLGPNINTVNTMDLLVYDFEGDDRAEVTTRTSDGSIDGEGKVIGESGVDYRPDDPYYIAEEHSEYLSIFDGKTGKELDRTEHILVGESSNKWGDSRGHRANSRLTTAAYLDGKEPSIIIARGIYDLIEMKAINFVDGELVKEWEFSSKEWDEKIKENEISRDKFEYSQIDQYSAMGNHQLSVGDVDRDGKDEIIYGAMTVDNNGEGLYTTGVGHGDALHVGDFDPDKPGLEVLGITENIPSPSGLNLRDARTGEIYWGIAADYDMARGGTANIDSRYRGTETWGGRNPLYNIKGEKISETVPPMNFVIWWDDDLLREILNDVHISKWDEKEEEMIELFTAKNCASNGGSKAVPSLQADLLGDWREEVIWRSQNNKEMRIYTTTDLTEHRLHTLMHNLMYRLAITWQNNSYNQPPHLDFYLGPESQKPRFNYGLFKETLDHFEF